MHILIDLQACQTGGSRDRGVGRYSLSLALAMARQGRMRGHRFSVLLSDRFPDTLAALRERLGGVIPPERIHVLALPLDASASESTRGILLEASRQLYQQLLLALQVDILHVASPFEGQHENAIVAIAAAGACCRVAVTFYDLIPYLFADHYLADPETRKRYHQVLLDVKAADLLLCISGATRADAVAHLGLPESAAVNISGAAEREFAAHEFAAGEADKLRERHGIRERFLLCTAGVDHRKNLHGLIHAYARLSQPLRQTWQLVIVCAMQPSTRKALQAVCKRAGLAADAVVFTGYVADADLIALYSLTDLFIFPSLYEGFGLPVLEAMSCGAPVIAGSNSSLVEVVDLPEALFDATSIPAMSAAITACLTNPELRQRLREHARVQARKFSWERSANRALDALGSLAATAAPRRQRPRLAYLSPLPPQRSGIADYSARLIPELARYYAIDLYTDSLDVADDWLSANFSFRPLDAFPAHARDYDRILYHLGNSQYHQEMFSLLRSYPGVVVQHDAFLSNILALLHAHPSADADFRTLLWRDHGPAALRMLREESLAAVLAHYPLSRGILEDTLGVLVHSHHARQVLAQHYGDAFGAQLEVVPFPRRLSLASPVARQVARERLGLGADAFVVCSFGFVAPTKLNHRLLDAWETCAAARSQKAWMILVGSIANAGDYGREIARRCHRLARCRITGYVDSPTYADWLNAADVVVQLRTESRGETSAAIFDALAHGVALICNAHGFAAELPAEVVCRLPDACAAAQLAAAIDDLATAPEKRQALASAGRDYVRAHHAPHRVATLYHRHIERFYRDHPLVREQQLLSDLAARPGSDQLSAQARAAVVESILRNRRATAIRRVYLDLTPYMDQPPHWLLSLLAAWDSRHALECVRWRGGVFETIRNPVCEWLNLPTGLLEESPVTTSVADAWIGPGGAAEQRDRAGILATPITHWPLDGEQTAQSQVTQAVIRWARK
ncbi:glycosyltransferase [Thiorhodovibrio frisius]|uniref:Glycosyltransferase n=1 Tax=Thiorhodovibrio frisius TaxID=631362 RepID=H8Z1T7_9GAMM|nr:glycosyltransferase [Thiorhodovibrio frisius]EIC22565.1 glycosyltransferase [Thiorhodovibrio frisius]WPL20006.1 Glycosyltransferase KanE [Thiorhodovibrio frisius]